MKPILGSLAEPIYAVMRVVVAFLYACHGAQKLFGVLGGPGHPHGLFLAAGIIEFACGLLMFLGLWGSLAAFLASGELAVGYFMFHFPHGFWPIKNQGELAVALCFIFLFIAARGSGSYSVDSLRGQK